MIMMMIKIMKMMKNCIQVEEINHKDLWERKKRKRKKRKMLE